MLGCPTGFLNDLYLFCIMFCICIIVTYILFCIVHLYCTACQCSVLGCPTGFPNDGIQTSAPAALVGLSSTRTHTIVALVGLSARTHTIVAHYDPLRLHQQPTRQNAPTARSVGPGLNASLKSRGPPPCIQSYKAFRQAAQKCRLPKTQPAPTLGIAQWATNCIVSFLRSRPWLKKILCVI